MSYKKIHGPLSSVKKVRIINAQTHKHTNTQTHKDDVVTYI